MPDPATKLRLDIEREQDYLVPIRESYNRRARHIKYLFEQLRRVCPHTHLVEARGWHKWGHKRMCTICGLIEDETLHSTGFHVLRDGVDVWKKQTTLPQEWDSLAPSHTVQIEWCYGDKDHPQHWVPRGQLTKGNGTRCSEYEGPMA